MQQNPKIALITGATSGIGKATAQALAGQGLTVVLTARDARKGRAVLDEIQASSGNPALDLLIVDLSSQNSIRALADEFKRKYSRLDILVNNAGGFYADRHITADGLELTFALNHLAYFLLTNLLLDVLKASAPARIVNVSSGAQGMGRMNFDDLQGEKRYSGQNAYNQSKLANVLFTYALARRLEGSGVIVNAVHPGVVRTNFASENATFFMRLLIGVVRPFMREPEKGAETSVYLATSPAVEGVSGKYFADLKPVRTNPISYEQAVQERLWDESARLVHLNEKVTS
jgi:NAD(P)-dependent dehydrogenase (short-subunit alcohol dehydrogenase family)